MRQGRARTVQIGFIAALFSVVIAGHAAGAQNPPASPTQTPSAVTVIVPDDEAIVSVEGQTVAGVGPQRHFDTAPIERGIVATLTLTVQWRPNNYTLLTRTKAVQFTPGDAITVDMTVEDPSDRAEIRYVPTPDDVVSEMIGLANVKADDVVFEPGCGDARVTIAAVKAGAKRGVGIDISPERIAEANANVAAEGLQDRIDIRLADALDIKDLSDATVVFLYMGDEFDALMRPILWKQLKVGSRVVSHRFMMGDWKPDKSIRIAIEDEVFDLHIWTITPEIKERAARPGN
jgi:uncharacterized protein (TIGR03000 family)